jgi:hypothetical protein
MIRCIVYIISCTVSDLPDPFPLLFSAASSHTVVILVSRVIKSTGLCQCRSGKTLLAWGGCAIQLFEWKRLTDILSTLSISLQIVYSKHSVSCPIQEIHIGARRISKQVCRDSHDRPFKLLINPFPRANQCSELRTCSVMSPSISLCSYNMFLHLISRN